MTAAKVLTVDDSLTMRALFTDVLERSDGIEVVGSEASAAEARELIPQLKPDVLTLDVEMPGMSGLDFLEELMRDRPMPVIMLSTLTQKGAATSFRAFELGAVECFPKPMKATPDEFKAIAPKLAALVRAAAAGKVQSAEAKAARRKPTTAGPSFVWNGKMIAVSASTGGVEALSELLASFPENCPPTVLLQQLDAGLVSFLAGKLDGEAAPKVQVLEDGMTLEQGHVYLAADPAAHAIVDRWPSPSVRLHKADPVQGFRPSANLLFATLAKTAKADAIGIMLTGMGKDGAAGLKALRDTGALTIVQDAATCMVPEAPAAAKALGAAAQELPLAEIGVAAINACRLNIGIAA